MKTYFSIDFETYFDLGDCSVKLLGPQAYIAHPKFNAYLVAIYGPDMQYVGKPEDAPWEELASVDGFLAHNAGFDQAIFHTFVCEWSPQSADNLALIPWYCTADLAVYCRAGRSLKDAAKDLLGIEIDKKMRDKMEKLSYEEACQKGYRGQLHAYALDDAKLCYTLWDKFSPQWPESERKISELNRYAGAHGVQLDTALLDKGLGKLSRAKWDAGQKIPWDWSNLRTPLSPILLGKACRDAGIDPPANMEEDSPECEEWEAKYEGQYPWVSSLRDWRKANIMEKKLRTLRRRVDPMGVVSYEIKYFGAHTGRFSGGGGFNIQNLPKAPAYGVDIRNIIVPRPGKKLVSADLSQIEARILLFFARDEETLAIIASGVNIYETHARKTMGWTGGVLEKENPGLYSLAKARVLGAGYQCGGKRFKEVAKMMAGVIITEAEAISTISDYRATNPKIVALWNRLGRDFYWAYQASEPYELRLPSGRVLQYTNIAALKDGLRSQVEINGNPRNTYGGKLTENLVQATARDVFTAGWLRLDSHGYKILFHVHDEYVIEVDSIEADFHAACIKQIIEEPIPWLEGCPIGAKVKILDRYKK